MLQSLFEQAEPKKKVRMVEKNDPYLEKDVRFREKKYLNNNDDA